jgi:hypothetical protein
MAWTQGESYQFVPWFFIRKEWHCTKYRTVQLPPGPREGLPRLDACVCCRCHEWVCICVGGPSSPWVGADTAQIQRELLIGNLALKDVNGRVK